MIAVFLDANVVVDFMDASAYDHKPAYETIRIVRAYFGKPLVSPFTFVIANHFLGKRMKNKEKHRQQMEFVFSEFALTPVAASFSKSVFESRFIDLEDAAQYQCAAEAKAKLIVTKDVHDFYASTIPVIHPLDFVNRYNNLLP